MGYHTLKIFIIRFFELLEFSLYLNPIKEEIYQLNHKSTQFSLYLNPIKNNIVSIFYILPAKIKNFNLNDN